MKILVTGGAGQLAQALGKVAGEKIFLCSKEMLDVTDRLQVKRVLNSLKPKTVIHTAAFTDVAGCERNSQKAYAVNFLGTRNLAQVCADLNIPLAYISSDFVFDGKRRTPYHEYCKPNPKNHYGNSKLQGEIVVRELCQRYYIIRTAWLFGEGKRNFCSQILAKARKGGEVCVVNDEFGSPTYAPHLARVILEIVEKGEYGIYHGAGMGKASRYDLACFFLGELGHENVLTEISRKNYRDHVQRPSYSVLACWRLTMEGLNPLPPWQEGVGEYARSIKLADFQL